MRTETNVIVSNELGGFDTTLAIARVYSTTGGDGL